VGWIFLGRKLDLAALLGIALIVAGVVVIQFFSGSLNV
jgi:small multidrug resistance pump